MSNVYNLNNSFKNILNKTIKDKEKYKIYKLLKIKDKPIYFIKLTFLKIKLVH